MKVIFIYLIEEVYIFHSTNNRQSFCYLLKTQGIIQQDFPIIHFSEYRSTFYQMKVNEALKLTLGINDNYNFCGVTHNPFKLEYKNFH